eukprot:1825803-Karenia_brevis.AAC.1
MIVRSANRTYDKCTNPVWLDAVKTRDELKPQRTLSRAAEYIQDIESGRPDKVEITARSNGKFVDCNLGKLGFTCKAQWVWSKLAEARYTANELQIGKDYADGH